MFVVVRLVSEAVAGEFEGFDCSWSFTIIGGELMKHSELRCRQGVDSVE